MKFKISWPTGIVISIVAFMIFILSFVFKVTFLDGYDHHLVSEDYYKEELNYQQEIDKLNNASALEEDISLVMDETGITIHFPSNFEPSKISGLIKFQRLSNIKIDFQRKIELKTSDYHIKNEDLVEGIWDVKIEWSVANEHYLFKKKINY